MLRPFSFILLDQSEILYYFLKLEHLATIAY
jgi:hypothetical protein